MDLSLSWIFSQWALFILGIGLMIYLYGIRTYSYFLNRKVPFIKPRAFIGNAGPMLTQTMSLPEYIMWLYNELKGHPYGGIYQFRTPAVLLRDPDLIKTVTVKDFEYFTDHMNVVTEDLDPLWGKGIFNLKGQRWKDMRAILSPAFTSSKMKTMFVLVDECGKQLVNFLEKCYSGYTPEKPCKIEKEGGKLVVELKDLFTRYTNDVIATSAFGVGVDSLVKPANEFYLMGKDASNFGGLRSLIWMLHSAFPTLMKMLDIPLLPKRVKKYFRSLIIDTIATREEKGIIRPDLVQLLMQAKKEALEDQKNPNSHMRVLEDDDLVAQAFLFFLAGFDTTSTLLCFACHQIAVHSDTQTKLQNEIDAAMKETGGKISYETLHGMKYLDMVISETLRLYPPSVATDRCCVKKYTLPSHPPLEIMPGECVSIPIYAIHRDPEYFPNPDTFDPERFSDENKHNIKPSTFFPFGIGPRICIVSYPYTVQIDWTKQGGCLGLDKSWHVFLYVSIHNISDPSVKYYLPYGNRTEGSRFALMESKIALVKLLHKFNLKVVPKTPIPIQISKKGFNMTVDGGFWMGLEMRNTHLNSH